MKTIFTNKTTGEKLELVKKEGQKYTLTNANGEEVVLYRIVLSKHYTQSEEETTIVTRKNNKHSQIKMLSPKGEELTFASIKELSIYLEDVKGAPINKGHLYNLVNQKSKSYLGFRVIQ